MAALGVLIYSIHAQFYNYTNRCKTTKRTDTIMLLHQCQLRDTPHSTTVTSEHHCVFEFPSLDDSFFQA